MPRIEPPAQRDKADRRCAFTTFGCATTKAMTDDEWCSGCKFYVCDGCSVNISLMGSHDVMEHKDNPDEDEGDDE